MPCYPQYRNEILPSQPPTFSIIICNYNGGAYVQGALDSLARQTRRDFEVILIDNGSSDGSKKGLKTDHLPAFKLMDEGINHGFARGNNLAAAEASGTWLALLNPDAAAEPNWLDEIAKGIERHPDVTSFASTQIAMHAPENLDGAGDNYLFWGIPWRGGYTRPVEELPGEGECFSACGASAVYARDVFEAHGGFDERYFCFCEDVDLGFRLRLSGERCVFLPEAVVHHAGGGLSGSNEGSAFSVRHGARNRLWTYLKCMPLRLLLITAPVHIALLFAILARGLMTGRFSSTLAGTWDALSDLGWLVGERNKIRQARKATLADIARLMPWNPLIMLGRKVWVRPTED